MKKRVLYRLFFSLGLLVFSCTQNHYSTKTNKYSHQPDSLSKTTKSTPTTIAEKEIPTNSVAQISPREIYSLAFKELQQMLEGERKYSFKRAVFITENAFLENKLSYSTFCFEISKWTNLCLLWKNANQLKNYSFEDSTTVALSGSIFHVMNDTLRGVSGTVLSYPFRYDFNDCFAKENWTNMFVAKLLQTHKGNCHSLPFLYKILAEELNVKAYLAFAPNHIYIKQKNKKSNWYNTELTNACFPKDGWIMSSGYISIEAIQSRIYMDTLSDKQSLAVCVNDLAKGYQRKFGAQSSTFVLACCHLGLKHFPHYTELLLLKAETLKQLYEKQKQKSENQANQESHKSLLQEVYTDMQNTYATLASLHYRSIPRTVYDEWINSMKNDKSIYYNQENNFTFKANTQ